MLCAFLTRTGMDQFRPLRIRCRQRRGRTIGRTPISRKGQERHMGPHAAASRPLTLSEQADELEERMMEELNDKIATKSALFAMADGSLDYVGGAELQG